MRATKSRGGGGILDGEVWRVGDSPNRENESTDHVPGRDPVGRKRVRQGTLAVGHEIEAQ